MSKASIRNVVEEPGRQFPGHFGGALSKALVRPENVGSKLVDSAMEIDGKVSIVASPTSPRSW